MISLTYHSIIQDLIPDSINAGGKHISLANFEKQMHYISKKKIISVNDNFNKNNNSILVTIDDGFKNNYKVAFPILKKYNIPFIIFLCTGFMEENLIWTDKLLKLSLNNERFGEISEIWLSKNKFSFKKNEVNYNFLRLLFKKIDNYLINDFFDSFKDLNQSNYNSHNEIFEPLSWNDVRSMVESGLCTIGAHTENHPILSKCNYETQLKEIKRSKQKIENEIKSKVNIFAYPNGSKDDYNSETIKILKKLDFKYAFTTTFGYNKKLNPLELERIGITSEVPMWKFKLLVNRLWRPFA